jgi:heterodisulfide reductase subunit B2
VCPMCQMNLEAYQDNISKANQMDLRISILYLPQLLGLAIGLPKKNLCLDLNLSITSAFSEKLNKTGIR